MKRLCAVNDIIGNHDVIQNGRNGYVCKKVNKFADAIKSDKNEKLIEGADKDLEQEYNTETMADKYSRIYFNVLKIGGSKTHEHFIVIALSSRLEESGVAV
jgi:glycosyltransferase involved in cell wall biosynthesis